jgi:hypothetical protein
MLKQGPELLICEPFGISGAQRQDPNHWTVINVGEHLTMMPEHDNEIAELKCSTNVLSSPDCYEGLGMGTAKLKCSGHLLFGCRGEYCLVLPLTIRLFDYATNTTIRLYDYIIM